MKILGWIGSYSLVFTVLYFTKVRNIAIVYNFLGWLKVPDILSFTHNLVPFRPWKIFVNLFKINTSVCTFIKIASMTTDLITANELIWEGKPWHLSSLFQPENGSKGTREKDSFYSSKGNYSLTIRCLEKLKNNNQSYCRLAEIKLLCLYLELFKNYKT